MEYIKVGISELLRSDALRDMGILNKIITIEPDFQLFILIPSVVLQIGSLVRELHLVFSKNIERTCYLDY
jgi:hypothetical protein